MSSRVQSIAGAIRETETGGRFEAVGASGERGAFQFMPETWKMWSKEVAGRVLPLTEANEYYVATMKIKKFVEAGYSDADIALSWNQGSRGECRRGVNRHGVNYDSCAYQEKVLTALHNN